MSLRNPDAYRLSNYALLTNVDISLLSEKERNYVKEYRRLSDMLDELESEERELCYLKNQRPLSGVFYALKLTQLRKKIATYSMNRDVLEQTTTIQDILTREKDYTSKVIEEEHRAFRSQYREEERQMIIRMQEEQKAKREQALAGYKIRQRILDAMGLQEDELSKVAQLAVAVVLATARTQQQDKDSFVCKTNLACCDTLLFSAFLIRALSLGGVTSRKVAEDFTNEFIYLILTAMKKMFPVDRVDVETIFNNRIMFYERVFMSKEDPDEQMQAIVTEYETILKTDELNGKYVDFSEKSPLPILGIFEEVKCRTDVGNFTDHLFYTVKHPLEQVKKFLVQ